MRVTPQAAEHGKKIKEFVVPFSDGIRPAADAWVEARVRLAQLMPQPDFAAIADYYAIIQAVSSPSGAESAYPIRANEPRWRERQSDVKKRLAKYARTASDGPQTPDTRPWWRRLFVG